MEIVSKCGIATTAREENVIGHYITDRDHIIKSTEQSLQSLINLATDHLDLLLIHRPDPLMDADEVADAFKHLHQSGKVRHFGVSNFTPAQFALLQSRLPFTLATNQVEISPVHQPLLLDGTLDQLQQLRVRPMAWSCLGGGRLFNDDYFQPLRDELAVVAEELNAGSIEQVKVRHFGVSKLTQAQNALLQSRLPLTLATNQEEISTVHQPLLMDGTLDQLQQLRIRPMAWSCRGGGRLFNEDYFQPQRDELAVVAEELNAGSIEQVVYAWVLRLPSQPLPIIGSG